MPIQLAPPTSSDVESTLGQQAIQQSSSQESQVKPDVKKEIPNPKEAAKAEKQFISQKGDHVTTFYTSDKKGGALYTIRELGQLMYDRVLGEGTFGKVVAIKGIIVSSLGLDKTPSLKRLFLGATNKVKKEEAEEIAVKAAKNQNAVIDSKKEFNVLQRVHHYNRALLGGVSGVQPMHSGLVQEGDSVDLYQTKMVGDIFNKPVSDTKVMVSDLVQVGWGYMTMGLVHVDIKTENIFVDQNQKFCIADHGGARFINKNFRQGQMSDLTHTPETTDKSTLKKLSEAKTYEEATLHSNQLMSFQLGVSMFENITRSSPFDTDPNRYPILPTRADEIKQWKKVRVQLLIEKGCDPDNAKLIVDLMDPNPNTRLTSQDLSKHLPSEVKVFHKGVALFEAITEKKEPYLHFETLKDWKSEMGFRLTNSGKTSEEASVMVNKMAKGDKEAIAEFEKLTGQSFTPFKTKNDLIKELLDKGCSLKNAQMIVQMMNADPAKRPSMDEVQARLPIKIYDSDSNARKEVKAGEFGKFIQDRINLSKPAIHPPPPSKPPPQLKVKVPPPSTPPPAPKNPEDQ